MQQSSTYYTYGVVAVTLNETALPIIRPIYYTRLNLLKEIPRDTIDNNFLCFEAVNCLEFYHGNTQSCTKQRG
jgi:hypothetical protein